MFFVNLVQVSIFPDMKTIDHSCGFLITKSTQGDLRFDETPHHAASSKAIFYLCLNRWDLYLLCKNAPPVLLGGLGLLRLCSNRVHPLAKEGRCQAGLCGAGRGLGAALCSKGSASVGHPEGECGSHYDSGSCISMATSFPFVVLVVFLVNEEEGCSVLSAKEMGKARSWTRATLREQCRDPP
jgi:hypothetical protein